MKKTREASRGVMALSMASKDSESSRRDSEKRGGPQVAVKRLAAVSSVDKAESTMKCEPQNPPKEL